MNTADVKKIVSLALSEDIGRGDVTTDALVPRGRKAAVHVVFRSPGVVCGLRLAAMAFKLLDPKVRFKSLVRDGVFLSKPGPIARIEGPARAILTGERVALNFLGRLSGIATLTRKFVQKVRPYQTVILDTRKTIPLLRTLERYAVRCGGGTNHRFDLGVAVLIKDNHRAFCSPAMSIPAMVSRVRKKSGRIEVEADNMKQVRAALDSSADIILLDNMSQGQTRKAVLLRDRMRPGVHLESSGGITLANVRAYAAAGVERISIGALTHSSKAVDVSLEFMPFKVAPTFLTKGRCCLLLLFMLCCWMPAGVAQQAKGPVPVDATEMGNAIFDDEALLDGYAQKYADEPKDILLAMVADHSVGAYKSAAAIRVFRLKYADQVLSAEKPAILRTLLRRLNRTDSAFVQVEIMHTVVVVDRYQYFEPMTSALIQKMDHYNNVVSANAYEALDSITKGSTRAREARVVFNIIRKTLFLSRKRLENVNEPDDRLKAKLSLLRWSIKVLGTQELKRLPSGVIRLL
ncbi:MAG TPA: carboxylating nicotinate-nucleotide diphosphorylase [Candidatus Omnitrophota bacterium]|nr:carboxylating nicotinate-nucleotide diphosphorylase [Candidatus Omnitrophota bacterium]